MEKSSLKVVCGIIVSEGRVLVARRDPERAFPLLWEFPGGKIESDEDPESALHRELKEELSLEVEILEPMEPVDYREDGHHLTLIPFLCNPSHPHAPVPHEHVELRWLRPGELDQIDWAPADIPIVKTLPGILGGDPD